MIMIMIYFLVAIRVVKTPSLTAFPIENSTFEVTCFVYDSDKLEDVKFLDRNNNNIKNSTDGNRRFTKVIGKNLFT